MKKAIPFLLSAMLSATLGYGQCDNPYYALSPGTVMVVENYDAKDKLQSTVESKVVEYSTTSNGYTATIQTTLPDPKGKNPPTTATYVMECRDGVIYMDMSGMIPQESMKMFGDMKVSVEMEKLEIPSKLSPGQKLSDGYIAISTVDGPIPMNMRVNITDRVVEGIESVSTPAGTFNCYKISYLTSSKMMMVNTSFKTVQFIAENMGAVKTETYKSNGSLMGYSILTTYQP